MQQGVQELFLYLQAAGAAEVQTTSGSGEEGRDGEAKGLQAEHEDPGRGVQSEPAEDRPPGRDEYSSQQARVEDIITVKFRIRS